MLSEKEKQEIEKKVDNKVHKDWLVECYGQQCDYFFCHSMAKELCHFEVCYTDKETDQLIRVEDFSADFGELAEDLEKKKAGLLCKLCYAEHEESLQPTLDEMTLLGEWAEKQ